MGSKIAIATKNKFDKRIKCSDKFASINNATKYKDFSLLHFIKCRDVKTKIFQRNVRTYFIPTDHYCEKIVTII